MSLENLVSPTHEYRLARDEAPNTTEEANDRAREASFWTIKHSAEIKKSPDWQVEETGFYL